MRARLPTVKVLLDSAPVDSGLKVVFNCWFFGGASHMIRELVGKLSIIMERSRFRPGVLT